VNGVRCSIEADDGDPVDVLVLMDEPAFPGCMLTCRPIGAILGEPGDKKDKVWSWELGITGFANT
jgi:inorganic pyrophosphatase